MAGASIFLVDVSKAAARLKQTVTDTAGNYSLNDLARGRYLLITSCVGYRKDYYLPPFAIQRDHYSYTAGNPFLAPSYQNSFELDYILYKKYTIAAEFDDIENRMEQWVLQNDTN